MTVAELLDILLDPDQDWNAPRTAPVLVCTPDGAHRWEIEGAHGTIAGSDPEIVLELKEHSVIEQTPDLQQAIHTADPDWDDDAPPRPLHDRVPWRIGVLDKDLLEDPDAIVDNASWIAGWYVYDCAALLEQLQAAQAEAQQLRVHQRALELQALAYRRARTGSTEEMNILQGLVEQVEQFGEGAR
jgi:hypothetical protein